MVNLPRELGIEVLIENANDFVWRHALKELLIDRPSQFSIHGPFLYMNLASPNCEMDQVVENYKWTFDYYNTYGARHVVLHPHGQILEPQKEDAETRKARCLENINTIAELALKENVNLLVENLPYAYTVFGQEDYFDLFKQIPSVGSIIDVGHCLIKGWDIPTVLEILGSKIDAFHINDNYGLNQADVHMKVGDGVFDYKEFIKAYKKFCPDARLVLEYLNVTTEEIVENANMISNLLAE